MKLQSDQTETEIVVQRETGMIVQEKIGITAQDNIDVVALETEKKQHEKIFRNLWRSCFGDPIFYENFYFNNVYSHNQVYGMQDRGMLHLNPYRCNVAGNEYTLHYIVGVATAEGYRRQGIMRKLMQRALLDMYLAKEPFTYLMPAKEQYYKPFDFCRVTGKKECVMNQDGIVSSKDMIYVSYCDMKHRTEKDIKPIFDTLNLWMKQRYLAYPVHDKSYFDLLYEEKKCQGGDVVFCFKGKENTNALCGVFAYVMNQNIPCVEQIITKEWEQNQHTDKLQDEMSRILSNYFCNHPCVNVVYEYPYMIRIVHMETFLELYAGYFLSWKNDIQGIRVIDSIIENNTGCYCFIQEDNRISVCKCRKDTLDGFASLTISQIVDMVFGDEGNIYFAEIV